MKVQVVANNSNKILGELTLIAQPRNGEWVKLNEEIYAIHRILHTTDGLTLLVIAVR